MNSNAPKLKPDDYLQTDFLDRVAHELRGPAGVALGALEELEHSLPAEHAETVMALLTMARRGIRRVLRTADNLHRAGQLEGQRVEWTRAPSDLHEILRSAARDAEALESRRGIRVHIEAAPEPCIVNCDAAWLGTALGELVMNAIRHAKRTASVRIVLEPDFVRIVVSDDGRGFSSEPIARFERPSERRGLGLSIPMVRDVMRAHAGELSIERSDDPEMPGARVVLSLPKYLAVSP